MHNPAYRVIRHSDSGIGYFPPGWWIAPLSVAIVFWPLIPVVLLFVLAKALCSLLFSRKNPAGDALKDAPDPPPAYNQSNDATASARNYRFNRVGPIPNNTRWANQVDVSWRKERWEWRRLPNGSGVWVTYVCNHPYVYDQGWRRLEPLP